MFSAISQPAVSDSLLTEVATSGAFPDPALFVYAVLGALVVASLMVAYAIFGQEADLGGVAQHDPRARLSKAASYFDGSLRDKGV
jgi:hypothetical protein